MKDYSPTGTTPKTDNRYRGAGEADDHVKILYDNAEERQDIRSVRCASRRGAIAALHGAGVALAGRTCRRRLGGHRYGDGRGRRRAPGGCKANCGEDSHNKKRGFGKHFNDQGSVK